MISVCEPVILLDFLRFLKDFKTPSFYHIAKCFTFSLDNFMNNNNAFFCVILYHFSENESDY